MQRPEFECTTRAIDMKREKRARARHVHIVQPTPLYYLRQYALAAARSLSTNAACKDTEREWPDSVRRCVYDLRREGIKRPSPGTSLRYTPWRVQDRR